MTLLHTQQPTTTTPDAPPLAGRFSYSLVRRNRPHTLTTWRTTPSPTAAQRLSELLGGQPQPEPVIGHVGVIATTDSLDIVLPGVEERWARWWRTDRHVCDSSVQNNGRPCACRWPLTRDAIDVW